MEMPNAYSGRPDRRPSFLTGSRRRLAAIAGLALLVLVVAALAWNGSGTRDARRDLRGATARIYEARNEVEEARQVLEQRIAELHEAQAAAVAEQERLDAEVVRERQGSAAGTLAPPLTEEERAAATLRYTDSLIGAPSVREPVRRP